MSGEHFQVPAEVTHNTFFLETFGEKRFAEAFLKKTLPPKTLPFLDLKKLNVLPRDLSSDLFKGKVADVIYRVPIKRTKQHVDFFAVLEHKSYNDALTIFQLWCYVQLICQMNLRESQAKKRFSAKKYRFPPVVPIIVYHGESAFTGVTQLFDMFSQLPGVERYFPRMEAILFDLSQNDEIPCDAEVPELKAVLTILRAVFRRDVGTMAIEVFRELKTQNLVEPEYLRLARLIWLYLVSSAKRLKRNYEQFAPIIQQETGDDKMPTMVEVWRAEGEARGRVEGAARTLLRILKKRLRTVPQHVEDRVMAIRDSVVLESLTEFALECKSIEEFEESLR
ncbi:MAG: Rpn family recombination-promoting nuclease/putative transposase [Thermoguttaceae bacterium]